MVAYPRIVERLSPYFWVAPDPKTAWEFWERNRGISQSEIVVSMPVAFDCQHAACAGLKNGSRVDEYGHVYCDAHADGWGFRLEKAKEGAS